MTKPLVSVIVACHNYGQYLKEAVESVVHQTYKNIEIIIINDGSTDDSDEIVRSLEYDNIRYLPQSNSGIVAVRNRGIDEAAGEFIIFLDADDLLDADYVEETLRVAQKNKVDIVYTDFRKFDAVTETSNFPEYNIEILKNHNFIHISSLIRKTAIGLSRFDVNLSGMTHEDWDFFLGICSKGARVVKCQTTFLNYRIHESSRNNNLLTKEQKRKYVDVYHYVIHKHIEQGDADRFGYLTGYHFADWYVELEDESEGRIANILDQNSTLMRENKKIKNSFSYKTAKLLVKPILVLKKIMRNLKVSIISSLNASSEDRYYRNELSKVFRTSEYNGKSKFAVIIHLFYVENWPLFKHKLELLPVGMYDIFITIPKQNEYFSEKILQDFPKAQVIKVPNRGRDVLPFIKVARVLQKAEYKAVLKFHSKKSTHRDDGQDWLESMLDQIIPEDPVVLDKIIQAVSKNNFGALGPADVYYPLTINFPANGKHMTDIVSEVFNRRTANLILQEKRKEYGFFGGTMFWISLDAIKPLLSYDTARFEAEAGQIDATFAHALERMFCIIPEIEGRYMYDSDGNTVSDRSYISDNVPEWSEDHEK